MAELPEVDTLRREMDKELSGKRIKSVDVLGKMEVIPGHSNKKQFGAHLEGSKITGVTRRGVLLIMKLDSDEIVVVDLANGGSVARSTAKEDVVKNTQLVLTFTQGGQLRFVDTKGGMTLTTMAPGDLDEAHPELASLGSDPLDEPISWTTFGNLMLRKAVKLKALLTDPTVLAGVGPVYSDEILFAAGLLPDRQSETMSTQEMRRLYRSVVEVMHAAAKYRGATLADGVYHDLSGKPGDYSSELKVFERDGQPCTRCRGTVTKAKIAGQVTYYCPECQV